MKSNCVRFTNEQERLVESMRQKVEQKVKNYREDFYRYDVSFIKKAIEEGLRNFVWFLSDSGTHFIEEYEHAEQQEYLRTLEFEEGHYLKNGRGNLFVCDLQTGEMKTIQSFQEVYSK